jgi:uncharacterized protein with FMN-binding domain
MSHKKREKVIAALTMTALTAVIVGTAVAYPTKSTVSTKGASSSQKKSVGASSVSEGPTLYKDGTYSATGTYFSPGGKESLNINVTLDNDIVTTAAVESGANDSTATTYQDSFIGGYKSYVVGKKINTIKLSNVSGSSLTSQGFNNALKQIEQKAKA